MVKAGKETRSSSKVDSETIITTKTKKAAATLKVILIAEQLLENGSDDLQLERFYHPGKGTTALFITRANKHIMEVLEFNEPRRSWFINNEVCADGRMYLTSPLDVTFFGLHILRKHCAQKALAVDSIHDEDSSIMRLLQTFIPPECLKFVADVKQAKGTDMTFYKYNPDKTLAWLAIKTRHVVNALKSESVHCGHSALSRNYVRSDVAAEDVVLEMDYLRMACDIVGSYVDMDLHETLTRYLDIPPLMQSKEQDSKSTSKRKSQQNLNASDSKKPKLSEDLVDVDLDVKCAEIKTTPAIQPRVLTTKEKAFAKGAKGTKSIASFFKK